MKHMEEKVYNLVSEHFGIPMAEITPAMELRKDCNATDLEIADFFQTVENTFHVTMSKEDALEIHTLAELANFISDHVEEIA